ncbi:UDP-N-acetylglucosamine--N-acetylmuramyl-(pentapeptide) pyrophosphoryl-undecaprenol N-acetylglucosamine transferase [Candidatus Peregrinibacteria bacterium]|nr:UDP-N-acetylglucosamine--N-acetylmuramyl-(pentapeptide) pyrophosphoryl-undecaprenol N-acetylglucosamine transferase [Candidatus Peregrinibacteria bacterium]
MRKATRVLLTGGGSGGHIQPNLALASALRQLDPSIQLLYVGSRLPLDASLVIPAGIPFVPIFTGKLRRYFDWRNFTDPFLAVAGFFQSFWIMARFWPHVVFAKGGFVSLPVALAAFLLRRPIVLHESDSVMGLSNRIVATLAKKVCVGFPEVMSDNPKTVFTGNPVRLSMRNGDPEQGFRLTGFHPGKPVLLVWGGSQGSEQINQLVAQELPHLKSVFQIVHIAGAGKSNSGPSCGPDGGPNCGVEKNYIQFEYLGEELPHIYAITDFVVGRAGANSLYELALVQKPSVLLPLKSAAHNHQALNADYFERMGASLVLKPGQPLSEVLIALVHSPAQIQSMKKALAQLAKPEAAETIANIILGLRTQDSEHS